MGAAHRGMIAFPGDLDSAGAACGTCHGDKVEAVRAGLMHTGAGMIVKTRDVFGVPGRDDDSPAFDRLGHSAPDSLLRKLCASCHLGQDKEQHALDAVRDRGGGCLACHVNRHPQDAHPALSARVEDARCFGCHSRSGRISLSYAGLAESDGAGLPGEVAGRLSDGRLVVARMADRHHAAGMACIDCHTGAGLMGGIGGTVYQSDAVDIACEDCHRNRNPRLARGQAERDGRHLPRAPPFAAEEDQEFLTTARGGSVLWHVDVREDALVLHRKLDGGQLPIPQVGAQHPSSDRGEHERLTCSACHARWAPRCIGCHVGFDPDQPQWDHVAQSVTPGRWHERRWGIGTGEPALGVDTDGGIAPFAPGMILTIEDRGTGESRFQRRFAKSAPHTTGPSRTCVSCHASGEALGLGSGRLEKGPAGWRFTPARPALSDGLPEDAWTGLDREWSGRSSRRGERSLGYDEMIRILEVDTEAGTLVSRDGDGGGGPESRPKAPAP